MNLKKNIIILTILSVVPYMIGLNTGASMSYGLLLNKFELSNLQIETFKSIFTFGLAIGGLIGGIAVDKWNRKKQLIIIALFTSIISGLIQLFNGFEFIFIHRILLGFSFGFMTMTIQVQIVELFIPKHRGKFLAIYFMAGVLGNLTYNLISFYFFREAFPDKLTYELLQIPYIFLPLLILLVINIIPKNSPISNNINVNIKSIFRPKLRLILNTMIILSIITVFAGLSSYMYQASRIIMDLDLHLYPLLIGFAASFICIFFIDSLGRKKLLYYGSISLMVITLINTILFQVIENNVVIISLIFIYMFLFTLTFNVTVSLLILEYLPSKIRGRGIIIFHIISWIPNFLFNIGFMKIFLNLNSNLSFASGIMFITLLLGVFFIKRQLFETKKLSLETIENKIINE